MPFRHAVFAMGTRFEIVLSGDDEVFLRAVAEEALEVIVAQEQQWSLFRRDSLLARINREGWQRPVLLDADSFELFEDALAVREQSGGAFDVGVAGLMRAWGLHEHSMLPAEHVADARSEESGASRGLRPAVLNDVPPFELDPVARTIRLTHEVAALDLGAIAKGHALDLAARVVTEYGIESALIHGGTSSVVAIGAPPGEEVWRVAVAGGEQEEHAGGPRLACRMIARLRDAALGVSAHHGRTANLEGRRIGHVMDPRTGEPSRSHAVVAAVIAPTARLADAWSTAALVNAGLGVARPAGVCAAVAVRRESGIVWIIEGDVAEHFEHDERIARASAARWEDEE